MRITQIDLWHVAIPLGGAFYPSWIPGFPQTENRFTLARLRTASGLEGWSAGAAMGRERQGLGTLLGPYLLGERADDIPSIRQRLREMGYLGIRAGWIEPACWDIVGKALDKPVYELLGGRVHERLRSYSYLYPEPSDQTCVYRDPELASERAAEYVAKGFTAVKFDPVGPYSAFDPRQLKSIRLLFDRTEAGTIVLEHVGLSTPADRAFLASPIR